MPPKIRSTKRSRFFKDLENFNGLPSIQMEGSQMKKTKKIKICKMLDKTSTPRRQLHYLILFNNKVWSLLQFLLVKHHIRKAAKVWLSITKILATATMSAHIVVYIFGWVKH